MENKAESMGLSVTRELDRCEMAINCEVIDPPVLVKDITIKLEQATPDNIQESQTVDVKHEVEIPEPDWSETEIKREESTDKDKEESADFPWQVYKDGKLIQHICEVGTDKKLSSTGTSNMNPDIDSCLAMERPIKHSASMKMIMFGQRKDTDYVNSGIKSSSTLEKDIKPMTILGGTSSESGQLFHCYLCEFSSNYQHMLVGHMRNHTREKHHMCVFKYSSTCKSAQTEQARTRTRDHPFMCTLCEYRCIRHNSLTRHMKTHTAEKHFKCTLCEYICTDQFGLTTHMRTHTGEKPFKCTLCDYRGSQIGNLTRHMRIHTGEKPFKCTLCQFKSGRKICLSEHMKIHTGPGDKLFKCIVCEYRCTLRSTMARHVRIHIGD